MNIPKKNIERFVTTLAFYNEKYPSNKNTNKFWAIIRKQHEMDCLKYDNCEICGNEDLLSEYLLTFICNKPECLKKVTKDYEEILKDWHEKY